MQQFTPYQYLLIAIANKFGNDKDSWDSRIEFGKDVIALPFEEQLELAKNKADEPILATKALLAHRDVSHGKPIHYIADLDATASGPQLMACMTGCRASAEKVNVVDTGVRRDLYQDMADQMNGMYKGMDVKRSDMKDPIMQGFYGSTATPKKVFGEGTEELEAFYEAMAKGLPGCWHMLQATQAIWNPNWTKYRITSPNGSNIVIPVMKAKDYKVEVTELGGKSLTFRTTVNEAKDFSRELTANITHIADAWVVGEMYKLANEQGWQLSTIHDSFWAPLHSMNQLRVNYNACLTALAKSDWLSQVFSELTGKDINISKLDATLADDIDNANYALS